ncbi:MAG TPA: hypothetical protein VFC23_20620 [Thermoanaerobaculia bacterium]|nr:hypothetical protein [Thermoanaerobaculia bacterium]
MEADGRPQKKPTSPWVYVGCGCAALVLLGMLGFAGLGWWGYRTGKEFSEAMTDPVKREAKVKSVLPYKQLPAGYYPAFAFSAPMGLMEMAMFSDRDPGTGRVGRGDRGFEQRGFMYMSMRQVRDNKEKMARFLRGEAPLPEDSGWSQSNVKFDPKEVVRRGTVNVGGTDVLYSAGRGEIHSRGHRQTHGLVTMVMPQCPHDPRLRFGMWFGPDPDPDKPTAETSFSGTNADPAALQEFLGHFQLCPG